MVVKVEVVSELDPPKTNMEPEKIGSIPIWDISSFRPLIFSGELLVSGSVCTPWLFFLQNCKEW